MIEKLSFHQAWELEKLCTEDLNYSVHFLSDLLENFDKIENHSAKVDFLCTRPANQFLSC
ncbi:MAG: hypothetical protein U0L57_01270 [Bacteroidales bacterium]|nr:hypothetical protein [Bacteroidales bacterium]